MILTQFQIPRRNLRVLYVCYLVCSLLSPFLFHSQLLFQPLVWSLYLHPNSLCHICSLVSSIVLHVPPIFLSACLDPPWTSLGPVFHPHLPCSALVVFNSLHPVLVFLRTNITSKLSSPLCLCVSQQGPPESVLTPYLVLHLWSLASVPASYDY